jgi:hypothetical protein
MRCIWTSYYLPTLGIKTHGLIATSVKAKTYVGMGYLGTGKVAKLGAAASGNS